MDLELLIFNMYKDSAVLGKKFRSGLCKKYKLKDVQISNICAKISKYQVEKFGSSLGSDNGFKSQEECVRLSTNNRQRKKMRLRG